MSADKLDVGNAQAALRNSLQAHWKFFLIEGIVLVILGMIAICVPPVATVTVEIFIGWLILLSGVLGLVMTFQTRGSPGFGWSLLSAVVGIAAGIVLLLWPLSGVLTLTVMLTAFLTVEGVVSIMYALAHRRERIHILGRFPESRAWILQVRASPELLQRAQMMFHGSALS